MILKLTNGNNYNMKKLSKLQRNLIYTEALIWYKNHIKCVEEDESRDPCGLCKSIWEAILGLGTIEHDVLELNQEEVYVFSPYDNGMSNYPEIYNQKPDGALRYWFPPRETKIRIEILEKAIALTR